MEEKKENNEFTSNSAAWKEIAQDLDKIFAKWKKNKKKKWTTTTTYMPQTQSKCKSKPKIGIG